MTISAAFDPGRDHHALADLRRHGHENVGATITDDESRRHQRRRRHLNERRNDVTTLAANVTGAGNAFAYTDANALTIGTVDGINGVSTNNGAISVTTTNGALTVSNTPAAPDVNAGTSTVALTAGGVNQLLTVTGTVTGTGGVTYTADNMTLTGATNAGAAIATLQPNTAGQLVNLGGADAAGTLGLTDAELDTVTAGTLRVGRNNSGNLTISAAIDTANTTTTTLISGGTVTQTAPITETNLAVNAVGAVTLTNAGNDVTTLAATVTGAGNAFAYTDANALTIGTVDGINGVSTNNGAISVATTNGALTVSNTPAVADVNAGTSTVALTAGGVNQLLTVTGTVTGTGGVTYTADNMSLTGATNAGAAIATLQPNTAGQLVNLGGADAAGTLGLTDAELDTVTAGTLRVGSATSGNMTISAALTPAGTTTLSLLSGGSVTENVGATITTTNLAVTSVGAVTLNQANDVTTLAAKVTGAGNAFAYTDANALTIGTVDGINGVSTNNGAISVATTNGALTVSNTPAAPDVNAGTSTVALTAGGVNQLLTVTGTVTGTGGVTYTADNMSLTGATNAGAAIATLQPNTAGQLVNLGGADAAGTLGLTDAELDTVTAGTLRVGRNNSGNLTISAAIDTANTTTTTLISGGTVTQTAPITETNLAVNAVGAVTLTNAGNDVTTLAATVTGAGNAFAYTDANALTIGTVDGINGITTNNGDIGLQTGGALAINQALSAGTAAIGLNGGGAVTQGAAGIITANELNLRGSGPFTLTNPSNDVNTVGANTVRSNPVDGCG